MKIHKVENANRRVYTVDETLHPRKYLQLVKDNESPYQDHSTKTKT
jgi:hypothetical protein